MYKTIRKLFKLKIKNKLWKIKTYTKKFKYLMYPKLSATYFCMQFFVIRSDK